MKVSRPVRPRRVAQHRHHAGEGLERGVVERAAAEGHAAADAQRSTVGIVDREAELAGLDAHRRPGSSCRGRPRRWSATSMPVSSAMRSAPMRTAGARWSSARFDTASMWFDSTAAERVHPSLVRARRRDRRPRWSRARTPAAWSTFHCEQCHLVYGAASIGFLADGCSRNSGATGSRRHASGLSAAVRLNADPELGGGARVVGHRLARARCAARSRAPSTSAARS